jgi:hypothetical protein
VQANEMRERMFTMRLSAEESARLDALAEHYGLNAAGLIRMLLKKEQRELNETLRLAGRGQPGLPSSLPIKTSGDNKTRAKR